MTKRGQKHPTSRESSVSIKWKQIRLSLEAPTCPAPLAGRQQGLRCPGRPDGCRKANLRAWQDELIAQVINCFANSSPFVLPHVICKAKFLQYLAIMHIISISVIIVISIIMVIKCISLISVIMGLKCYNCNKVCNEYNLFGLRLRFESHIPEHVVDQMNNSLVQYENLFGHSSFDTVPGTTRM